MPKLSKQAGIELIIAELQKGTATLDIFGAVRSKSELAESTFYEWLKIAKNKHTEAQNELNKLLKEQTINKELESKERAINERNRRLAILNNKFEELAELRPITVKTKEGKEIKITKGDYLKAIEVMAKLDDRISKAEGTDAASKQEVRNTDKEGNDIKSSFVVLTMTEAEAQKKLDALS
jgi:uncharacterized caspase-like protein